MLTLFENDTDSFGTLRKKAGLPADFWSWKPNKGVNKPPITKFYKEKLMIIRWNGPYKTKSIKLVSILSSKHTWTIQNTGKIHFSSKKEIMRPDAICDYNKTIGGVNSLSRAIIPCSIQRKTLKRYQKIGELFIDFAVYNVYIIWKKANIHLKDDQLKCRMDLVKTIMFHLTTQTPQDPGRGEPINLVNKPLRLVERHFITPNHQNIGRKRSCCVRCTKMDVRKETIYQCRQCDVALCIFPCFEIYYTQRDIAKDFGNNDADDSDYIKVNELLYKVC